MTQKRLACVDIDFSLDINGIRYCGDKERLLNAGIRPMSSASLFESAALILPFNYPNFDVCNKVQESLGVGDTVWGIKKIGSDFFSELYFFYPEANPSHRFESVMSALSHYINCDVMPDLGHYKCLSIDLAAVPSDYLNVYYLDHEGADRVIASSWEVNFHSGEKVKKNTYYAGLSCAGFSDAGFSFDRSYAPVLDVLMENFPEASEGFLDIVKSWRFLECKGDLVAPVGCAVKGHALGLYYMGLDVSMFLDFLRQMSFPEEFIDSVGVCSDQLSHLSFDVGIDLAFSSRGIEVSKSSFFGSF